MEPIAPIVSPVSSIPSDNRSIVAFVDPYDTLLTAGPATLVGGLLASGSRVLFPAQRACCRSLLLSSPSLPPIPFAVPSTALASEMIT